jgi:hypothetical protein
MAEICVFVAMGALAAVIAVPNRYDARNASAVAQARADMGAISTGLEMYKMDRGAYPWQNGNLAMMKTSAVSSNQTTLERLTTPIAYIAGIPPYKDPFVATGYFSGSTGAFYTRIPSDSLILSQYYWYNARNLRDTSTWGQSMADDVDPLWYFLESAGPDLTRNVTYQNLNAMVTDTSNNRARCGLYIYDSTNGTVSRGSIWKVGGAPSGYGVSMASMINGTNQTRVQDWDEYR